MASGPSGRLRQSAEALAIPVGALAAAMVVFGIAMAGLGRNPLEVYELIYRGAFASAFSWQNTLGRAPRRRRPRPPATQTSWDRAPGSTCTAASGSAWSSGS